MTRKSARSLRLGLSVQVALRAALLGAVTLAMSIAPAKAEELKDWQYDAETGALTLVLPDTVTPLVSVLAPDQLLLELPDTQIGDVMGQNVQDGVVDHIVLEQATPETVWVVMEFAAGTVLSASQQAVPLAETENGDQPWQIRPVLADASRQAASQPANQPVSQSARPTTAAAPTRSSADSLRSPAAEVAQAPDFSDLPVLEPAMPISEPVSVPPLNTPVPVPVPVSVPPLDEPVAESGLSTEPDADIESAAVEEGAVDLETANEGPVFEVEVIPAEPRTDAPVVSEPAPVEPVPVERATSPANSSTVSAASESLPVEPPFLENVDVEASDEVIGDEAIDDEPIFVEVMPTESEVPSDVTAGVTAESQVGAAPPAPTDRIASGSERADSVAQPVAVEEPIELAPEEIRPSNTSRWPAPIPFGQPLPR